LLESPSNERKTPLHIACREGNQNIFQFLYSSLATRTNNFEIRKSREFFLATDVQGRSFLHVAFENLNKKKLVELLKELEKCMSNLVFGQDIIKELVLMKSDYNGSFLSCYGGSKYFNIDFVFQILNWVNEQFASEFLSQFILAKNKLNQTTLFKIRNIAFLEGLGTNFADKKEQFENFLCNVDENDDTFFTFYLKQLEGDDLHDYFIEIYDFLIGNCGENFVEKFLLIENGVRENCLNVVCNKDDYYVTTILDHIFSNHCDDLDFIMKLINKKLFNKWDDGKLQWIRENRIPIEWFEHYEDVEDVEDMRDSDSYM
jgi:hypothetical protein